MTEKKTLIQKMLTIQKKLIAHEHAHGWSASTTELLKDDHTEYAALAQKVLELAHAEQGSQR